MQFMQSAVFISITANYEEVLEYLKMSVEMADKSETEEKNEPYLKNV